MNTGVQRSGTTPFGAITANTPIKGKLQHKKDLPSIMIAHGINYVATCSASYPLDLYNKILMAKKLSGTKYIHINIPCPPGWGFEPRYSVKIGKLAVESGLHDLSETINGKFTLTGTSLKLLEKRKLMPLKEYFRAQTRFRILTDSQIAEMQKQIDAKWDNYYKKADED